MKKIKVTNGTFIIDEQDWDLIKDYHWYVQKDRNKVVASAKSIEDPSIVQIARIIMKPPKHMVVDHIDGNGLNNQRSNLRIVPQKQNTWNRKVNKNAQIKYRGVTKAGKRFDAVISAHRCSIFLGNYTTADQAGAAYDKAARILYGDMYVRPNISQSLEIDILNENLLMVLRDL